jgi:acrylyl-CoA reductase (NADPH)
MKAIYLTRDDGKFQARVTDIAEGELPEGDVLVRVEYSTLNYKDALALTDTAPIVRKWPMVAGIDGAGVVEESAHPDWTPGDRVILNGWGASENRWGALAQKSRLMGDWLVRVPEGMTTREAMAIGTAGYTAMLCVMALERLAVSPDRGEVLVTGATGGVGSTAIAIHAHLGYRVAASTGKLSERAYLESLGAAELIDRASLMQPGKPLQKERWAGVVDSIGSHTLANACAQTIAGGAVTACGLAQGMDLPATVAPFILRGVTLAGITGVTAPVETRRQAWKRLATQLDRGKLASMVTEVSLADALARAPDFIASRIRGRVVVDVNR